MGWLQNCLGGHQSEFSAKIHFPIEAGAVSQTILLKIFRDEDSFDGLMDVSQAFGSFHQSLGAVMGTACHILVEGNSAIVYSSRNGQPRKVLPVLEPFLDKFWQEREISGESIDTPGCLVAQIVVRFGFESAEDDFSNLRVGPLFDATVSYLYQVKGDRTVQVWVPTDAYRSNPALGLAACQPLEPSALSS